MLSFARKIFGSTNNNILKELHKIVEQINYIESEIRSLDDGVLFSKTLEFKERLNRGQSLNELLVQAFAVVREVSRRLMNMRHFDVQLIGGMALHRGMIAEMKTGEGKTLVATLAAYLNCLDGKGVHVVTVNDYLARRDSEWMGKIYEALGVTVGCITANIDDEAKRHAYNCDIVYSTNNELGFDYLRDNMKFSRSEMVQRELRYAIIDEVDSILIDEARTPLIISGQIDREVGLYKNIDQVIRQLEEKDYLLDEKSRSVVLTEDGISKIENLLGMNALIGANSSLYDVENVIAMHYVDQALRAHKLFSVNRDYIVKDGQVIIIDEFTGRMMRGRRYSEGLHQALEAKEGVEINNENKTLASITFQNYFRMYNKLSGMTGTAATESKELWGIYKLHVIQIPTNSLVIRKDLDDEIYATEEEKYQAVIDLIIDCHKRLQPVLVGTISIEKSEVLSRLLTQRSLKHSVLNARYHEQEAYIIAQAGRPGMITIATNMAGRGTDIQLGGNLEMLLKSELKGIIDPIVRERLSNQIVSRIKKDKETVISAGGLYIIATERHESRRIDNQLRGRAGRQGDPGTSRFFLSLEDDLLRIFGSDRIKSMLRKLGLKKNESIKHSWINKAIERAQAKVEAKNYDIRKSLLRFDDVINDQRKVIFEQRNHILDSESFDLANFYEDVNINIVNQSVVGKYYGVDFENCNDEFLVSEVSRVYGINIDIKEIDKLNSKDEIIAYLNARVIELIDNRRRDLEKKDGRIFNIMVKDIMLNILDSLWSDHISVLDALKQSISLRAVAQKDPLNEFKKEAFVALEFMLCKYQELTMSHIVNMDDSELLFGLSKKNRSINDISNNVISLFGKVSRNSLCPCGSKKKYKHCHGIVN